MHRQIFLLIITFNEVKRESKTMHFFCCRVYTYSYLDVFAGSPVVVKTDILVRSMGPICELDMVSSVALHQY